MRLHRVTHVAQLVHELGVDLEPARGVDDHDVLAEARGFLERALGHRHRVLGSVVGLGPDRHVEPPTEHAQLLDRGRPLQVGGNEQHLRTLALELTRELARGSRLAGTLEPGEHHDRRRLRAHRELACGSAERRDELLVHDLDDLLRGAEALLHLGAVRALLHPADEALDDLDVHVGFEEGQPDLAGDLVDVLLVEPAAAAQAREDPVESVGQCVEHRRRGYLSPYSKMASTNSVGSNTTKSFAPSPIPTTFTGIPSSA